MAMAIPKGSQNPQHKKLPKLPKDARVEKRPSLRPAILSPYSASDSSKVVYVSAKTPFLSAVKRVEKLLRLSDKRTVQSATTVAKDQVQQARKRKRGYGDEAGEDEIEAIARVAEEKQKSGENHEEVLIKGTGKAIQRVMELGVWFQQRSGEYAVKIRTGSLATVDDVTSKVNLKDGNDEQQDSMDVDGGPDAAEEGLVGKEPASGEAGEEVSESRLRYMSVLEVAVSLK